MLLSFGARTFAAIAFTALVGGGGVVVVTPPIESGGVVVRTHHHSTPAEIQKWYDARQQELERNRIQRIHRDDEEVLLILVQSIGGLYG